jgi:hypothetical protein
VNRVVRAVLPIFVPSKSGIVRNNTSPNKSCISWDSEWRLLCPRGRREGLGNFGVTFFCAHNKVLGRIGRLKRREMVEPKDELLAADEVHSLSTPCVCTWQKGRRRWKYVATTTVALESGACHD